MAGLAFQIPGGRYRRAEFFICIPPGMNRQFLLDGVRAFKQEVREFCILGSMNMLSTGFIPKITTNILLSQLMFFTSINFLMQPISFVLYPGILLFYAF